jgi:hypothetical protein
MEDRMEVKTVRGKQHRTLPQSLEEARQMWEESRIETPKTITDLVERGWVFEGGDETLSWDCKTSEGFVEFYRLVDGFGIHVKIPFTSIRVYGMAAISYATFDASPSFDKHRLAFLDFEDGNLTKAGSFNEKSQTVYLPAHSAANGK